MLVRPLSTVDNTRDYDRVSHSRQWSNYNVDNKKCIKYTNKFIQSHDNYRPT